MSADRKSQDKNLVGSFDHFAKTARSRDSVDSFNFNPCVPLQFLELAGC